MTDVLGTLNEYLRKTGARLNGDFLTEGTCLLTQLMMDLNAIERIGAAKHERTAEQTNQRNVYRKRLWDTRFGTIELQIPKLQQGSYSRISLEPRRRAQKSLAVGGKGCVIIIVVLLALAANSKYQPNRPRSVT